MVALPNPTVNNLLNKHAYQLVQSVTNNSQLLHLKVNCAWHCHQLYFEKEENTMVALSNPTVNYLLNKHAYQLVQSVTNLSLPLAAAFLVGLVYCLRDLQVLYSAIFFIKNRSYNTFRTFKNYFVTMFSIFSDIQMDSKKVMPFSC